MPKEFVGTLKDHAAELLSLEKSHAREFLRMLEDTRDMIRGRLLGFKLAGDSFNEMRLRAALLEAQTGIEALRRLGNLRFEEWTDEAKDLALEHVTQDIGRLSKAFDELPRLNLNAAKVLSDPTKALLAETFDTSMRRYGAELLGGVRREMFSALYTGESFSSAVKRVASDEGPLGKVGEANAERLLRTETSQAYNTAQLDSLEEAGEQIPGLKKTWMHVGSYRCPTCMPLHGTTRPLDGTWTVYRGKPYERDIVSPPAHPHCVCRIVGMKPKWKASLEKLGYLDQDPDDSRSKPTNL